MKKEATAAKRTQEDWYAVKKPQLWQHRAAGALLGWPVGMELTEQEYMDAIEAAGKITLR